MLEEKVETYTKKEAIKIAKDYLKGKAIEIPTNLGSNKKYYITKFYGCSDPKFYSYVELVKLLKSKYLLEGDENNTEVLETLLEENLDLENLNLLEDIIKAADLAYDKLLNIFKFLIY